jgi:hypothetical protein
MSGDEITPVAGALEARLFRGMIVSVIAAVSIATFVAPWPVVLGLVLGGTLALLNYHWLRLSVAAIFNVSGVTKPRVRISSYLFRYFIVGAVVFGAYKFQLASLPAMIAGLCALVPALFAEAIRQFYLAIIYREESF